MKKASTTIVAFSGFRYSLFMKRLLAVILVILVVLLLVTISHKQSNPSGVTKSAPQESISSENNNVLFKSGFESGSLDDWIVNVSGIGVAETTSYRTHTGEYAAALKIALTTGIGKANAVRLEWNNRDNAQPREPNIPDEAYYSTWYYFPEKVVSDHWLVWQWKQDAPNPAEKGPNLWLPVYTINANYNKEEDAMKFILWKKIDDASKYDHPGNKLATSQLTIPLKEWVHLVCFYKWSASPNGEIKCWQNGVEIFSASGIRTEFDYPTHVSERPRVWGPASYASKTLPLTHTLYVDDVTVSVEPL